MKERSFTNLSSKECEAVYPTIIKNSNDKWNDAKLLADKGKFGSANNLLIISIEELIKALLVFLDGNGFRFRQTKGVKRIFTDHNLRHVVASMMFVANIFGDDLFSLLKKIKQDPSILEDFFVKEEKNNSFLIEYFSTKLTVIEEELVWFSKMENKRQEGLYVDYSNKISSPSSISKDDFEDIYKRSTKIRQLVRMLIISIERGNQEVLSHVEKIKTDFDKENHYLKISSSIEILLSTKKDGGIFSSLLLGLQSFQNEIKNNS